MKESTLFRIYNDANFFRRDDSVNFTFMLIG
jgi:hypothetical protein